MAEHGPNLGMPYTRPLVMACSRFEPRAVKGLGERFSALLLVVAWSLQLIKKADERPAKGYRHNDLRVVG